MFVLVPTRPPTPGGGAAGMMSPHNPNVNVQIMSFYPNYPSWYVTYLEQEK